MTSPKHLWSGDWRRDSDAAARELARRRAQGQTADEAGRQPADARDEAPTVVRRPAPTTREPASEQPTVRRAAIDRPTIGRATIAPRAIREPAPPAMALQPQREPLPARAAAALRRAIGQGWTAIKGSTGRQRRATLLLVLGALVVVGVAYGLAEVGGSGGSPASAVGTGQPWLGVELSQPPGGGVIVGHVFPGGPADRAGIQAGDVILSVGNQPVNAPADVDAAISNLQPGDNIQLTVLRGADSYTTLVRVSGRPPGTP